MTSPTKIDSDRDRMREAARRIAAGAPPLTSAQKDALRRILGGRR